jgi:tryptophanyl-tRNA synthetase
MMNSKKIIFSGMQPSGMPTIGNYFGAIKNWKMLQNEYNCFYCVVDMHCITVRQDPVALRNKSLELAMIYVASGIDYNKSIFYYQSHVSAHAELAWILNCFTYTGEASRMIQFKEKSAKNEENINVGLFSYPILQAADILLFQTDLVPVGEDQRQHLELCRDIAQRFNNIYGPIFRIPEMHIDKKGAKIMSLQEPEKKMSKSGDNNSAIFLLDEPDVIISKIKKAVTDSDNVVSYGNKKPGISNLIEIYAIITKKSIEEIETEFKDYGYGIFKKTLGEAIIEELRPIREEFYKLNKDKDFISGIMKEGAIKANEKAQETLHKIKYAIGYII